MIGWITDLPEANQLFDRKPNALDMWNSLDDQKKTAYLHLSYDQIIYSDRLSIPTIPTNDELQLLKNAQAEQAAYQIALGSGGIRRTAAQSQGITAAGIVEETYDLKYAFSDVCPTVINMLSKFKANTVFLQIPIYRE